MGVLHEQLLQRLAAQRDAEAPGLRLVQPHERGLDGKAPVHAKAERYLQRLQRVVAAVGIA